MQKATFRLTSNLIATKTDAEGKASLINIPAGSELHSTSRGDLAEAFVEVRFNQDLFVVFKKDLLSRSNSTEREIR